MVVLGKIGFEPMMSFFITIFKIAALNHSAIYLQNLKLQIIRVAGFEPTIFYAQDKYDTITLYPKRFWFYVNKIKKAIIKANRAIASVNAKPKIV